MLIFILEDHLLARVEFLINLLDVFFNHFNEDLTNIFIPVVCSVDDWLLRITLIIEANRCESRTYVVFCF